MNKIIISLILALSILSTANAYAPTKDLVQAIKMYQAGNYTGALLLLQNVKANDPGNALAHYYLAICYVQTGNKDKALAEYNQVIVLSPNSELAKNSAVGINYLTPSPAGVQTAMPILKQDKGFISDKAKSKIQDVDIKTIIDNVNNKRDNLPEIYNRLENLDPSQKKSSEDSNKPTQEQIAQAMQILSNAGINTANQNISGFPNMQNIPNMQNLQMNPEMMQLNMLMGAFGGNGNNNNNNSMSSMMPYLMMMQNGQGNNKVDPETIQAMMSTMMMPNITNFYDNNSNNSNY